MTASDLRLRLANFDLYDVPGHLLRRNQQRAYEIFSRHVGDDITRQQVALLITLLKNPGANQRDLVERTGIDKSTLKEMTGRMVGKKWIRRSVDSNDRRAWTMEITAEGEQLIASRIDAIEATERYILAPLSEEERLAFVQALRKLLGLENSGSRQ